MQHPLKLKIIPAIVSAAILTMTLTAQAEEVTVEAIRVNGILPDRLESVPGSFSVVDEAALIERRPFTLREALNNVPGINIVGEDAFVLAPNIGIRGLARAEHRAHCCSKTACRCFWHRMAIHLRTFLHHCNACNVLK